MATNRKKLPAQFWIGLALIAVSWPLNWLLEGLRTHLLFFPLWLGYSLVVDGIVYYRKGHSLLTRNRGAYVGLFLASAPAWWLFEVINLRTQNWVYQGRELFSFIEYAVLASFAFSTVIPAVFESAELFSTFSWLKGAKNVPQTMPSRTMTIAFFITGWAMLGLLMAWPRYFFPFVWLSVYFILDPINVWRGNRSLMAYLAAGHWKFVFALWLGVLLCGFFWEMWNFYSFPRWVYHVPFVDFLHIFEMPVLGYGGYLPFAMELFALYHLIIGVLRRNLDDYVHIAG